MIPKPFFFHSSFRAFPLHLALSSVLGFNNVKCLALSNVCAQHVYICMCIYAWMTLLALMLLALCSALSEEILPYCLLGQTEETAHVNIFSLPSPETLPSWCQLNSGGSVLVWPVGPAVEHRRVLQLAGLPRSANILELNMDRWLTHITIMGSVMPSSRPPPSKNLDGSSYSQPQRSLRNGWHGLSFKKE